MQIKSNPPARARFPMRVGGRKSSVMRKFSGAAAALWLVGALSGATAGEAVKYKSPELAFEQGLGAYKSGFYEMAIPALEQTVAEGTEVESILCRVLFGTHLFGGRGADRSRQGLSPLPDARQRKCRHGSGGWAPRTFRCQGADGLGRLPAAGTSRDWPAARPAACGRLFAPCRDLLWRQGRTIRACQDLP